MRCRRRCNDRPDAVDDQRDVRGGDGQREDAEADVEGGGRGVGGDEERRPSHREAVNGNGADDAEAAGKAARAQYAVGERLGAMLIR